MKTLILMVGLPRSGKSTWAKQSGFPIVSPDAIRLSIHGEAFNSKAEPWVWVTAKVMVSSLFEAGHNIVVLDATNTSRKRRDEWISDKWETRFKSIDISKEVCMDRAKDGGREDLLPVIERMVEFFEPLEVDEAPWDPKCDNIDSFA